MNDLQKRYWLPLACMLKWTREKQVCGGADDKEVRDMMEADGTTERQKDCVGPTAPPLLKDSK